MVLAIAMKPGEQKINAKIGKEYEDKSSHHKQVGVLPRQDLWRRRWRYPA
jgi:hypothetical protein